MSLDATTKELLNKFADSQPALNDDFNPRSESGIALGDLLDEAHGAIRSAKAIYRPAQDGGTDGETYSLKELSIPEGALITRSWVATNTAAAAAASLTFETGAGSVALGTIADASASAAAAGTDNTATPQVVPAATTAQVTIGGGVDAEDGEFLLVVEYIYPVK